MSIYLSQNFDLTEFFENLQRVEWDNLDSETFAQVFFIHRYWLNTTTARTSWSRCTRLWPFSPSNSLPLTRESWTSCSSSTAYSQPPSAHRSQRISVIFSLRACDLKNPDVCLQIQIWYIIYFCLTVFEIGEPLQPALFSHPSLSHSGYDCQHSRHRHSPRRRCQI